MQQDLLEVTKYCKAGAEDIPALDPGSQHHLTFHLEVFTGKNTSLRIKTGLPFGYSLYEIISINLDFCWSGSKRSTQENPVFYHYRRLDKTAPADLEALGACRAACAHTLLLL